MASLVNKERMKIKFKRKLKTKSKLTENAVIKVTEKHQQQWIFLNEYISWLKCLAGGITEQDLIYNTLDVFKRKTISTFTEHGFLKFCLILFDSILFLFLFFFICIKL